MKGALDLHGVEVANDDPCRNEAALQVQLPQLAGLRDDDDRAAEQVTVQAAFPGTGHELVPERGPGIVAAPLELPDLFEKRLRRSCAGSSPPAPDPGRAD